MGTSVVHTMKQINGNINKLEFQEECPVSNKNRSRDSQLNI